MHIKRAYVTPCLRTYFFIKIWNQIFCVVEVLHAHDFLNSPPQLNEELARRLTKIILPLERWSEFWCYALHVRLRTEIPTLPPPVLARKLPFLLNISGFLFSHNILPVFETLTSQRKIMFSLFNQSFLAQFFAIFLWFLSHFYPFGRSMSLW